VSTRVVQTRLKVRTRTTADAVVGGVIGPLDAPEALLLGLPDDTGRLRVAGRTGPLTLPARRELGALLIPAQRTHPWPEQIPASRFVQLPGDLIDYTPTVPRVEQLARDYLCCLLGRTGSGLSRAVHARVTGRKTPPIRGRPV
jgi:hypothetical protein